MRDIREGKLEIRYIQRADLVRLGKQHRSCPGRRWDSFAIHLAGECDYHFADGTDICAGKNTILYLPYGVGYTMDSLTSNFSYIVVDFRVDREHDRQYFAYTPGNPERFEKLFQKLRREFHSVVPDAHANALAILFQIYSQIIRDFHPCYINSTTRKTIQYLANYIHDHIHSPNLSVQSLIIKSQISETHLRRLFMDMYGMPPSKYIMNARISRAKSLMDMHELTLEDISVQCGFSSYSYFCTAFKAATGATPSVYREKYLGTMYSRE